MRSRSGSGSAAATAIKASAVVAVIDLMSIFRRDSSRELLVHELKLGGVRMMK